MSEEAGVDFLPPVVANNLPARLLTHYRLGFISPFFILHFACYTRRPC
jgi:hypothetical protein